MMGVTDIKCTPIIALDMWEHAYWVDHDGDTEKYLNQFWKVIDWEKVSKNFEGFNVMHKVAPII